MVFDCDGVLVDSEPTSHRAWAEAMAHWGHTLTDTEFAASIGTTDNDVAVLWGPRLGCQPAELLARANDAFASRAGEIEIFKDSFELRRSLTVPASVGTNSERWRLEAILDATGLGQHFEVTVTTDDVVQPKPAPDIYLQAFDRMGVPATDGLVIEDSPSGIDAAKASGAYVVAVDRGHLPTSDLAAADLVVDSLFP